MKSMDILLEQARDSLNRAINEPEILAILSQRGYGAEQLQEGLLLCAAALESIQTQGVARYSKVNARQVFLQQWKIVKLQYNHDVRMARLALKAYSGSHYLLQLDGIQTNAYEVWYAQAKDFYFGLRNLPELQIAAEKLGLTAERIELGMQSLQKLEGLRLQQQSQMNSAGRTRQQRDEALQIFNRWMSDFRQYARLALASTPHYLQTLALETTTRRAAKKVDGGPLPIPASMDMARMQVQAG